MSTQHCQGSGLRKGRGSAWTGPARPGSVTEGAPRTAPALGAATAGRDQAAERRAGRPAGCSLRPPRGFSAREA